MAAIRNRSLMAEPSHRLPSFLACLLVCFASIVVGAEREERRFRAHQVFDYEEPILFESDFSAHGLDKWNLSEDDRYRLAKTDPSRLRIADAPGMPPGTKAVRFTVPRAPNSFRAEISLPHERGFNERWYGILMYVAPDWEFDPNRGADIVIQWHAIPGNWKSTHPNLVIAIQDSNWLVRQNYGSPQDSPTRTSFTLESPLRPGTWVSWVVYAKWSPEDDGRVRIWMDGKPVLSQDGPNVYGTIGLEYTPYLKTGIYHPEWYLTSEARKKRYEAEIPGIVKKETYTAKVVVGSDAATYDMIAPLVEIQTGGKSKLPPAD